MLTGKAGVHVPAPDRLTALPLSVQILSGTQKAEKGEECKVLEHMFLPPVKVFASSSPMQVRRERAGEK